MTKKNKRRLRFFIKIVFSLIFLGVLASFILREYKDYRQEIKDALVVQEIQSYLNTEVVMYEEVIPEETQTSEPTRVEISSKDLLISNVSYIGVVELPSLGVKKPIISGVTRKDIATKVGWEPHSSMPGEEGNVVLAAHNASNYFGRIYSLSNGSEIIITTKDGVFTYRVFDKFKVHKKEVWVYNKPQDYKETVTLITCVYPDNNYRWIVRGELVKTEKL